jgi:hypothetical protein
LKKTNESVWKKYWRKERCKKKKDEERKRKIKRKNHKEERFFSLKTKRYNEILGESCV